MAADLFTERAPRISCEAVRRVVGVEGHCNSCHDDEDMGYDLCSIDTPKGYVEVCCFVMVAYEQAKKQ